MKLEILITNVNLLFVVLISVTIRQNQKKKKFNSNSILPKLISYIDVN